MEHNDWYVDEYQPNRWWIRRDAGDGGIETLAQDVETKELADECVLAINSHDQLLAACHEAFEVLEDFETNGLPGDIAYDTREILRNALSAAQPPKNHQ